MNEDKRESPSYLEGVTEGQRAAWELINRALDACDNLVEGYNVECLDT